MNEHLNEWLDAYLDGELTPPHQRQVEAHLAHCPECRALLKQRRALASLLLQGLRDESGQEMTEYALVTSSLLLGTGVSLLVFIPNALSAYKIYINGFYMVLGLPIP